MFVINNRFHIVLPPDEEWCNDSEKTAFSIAWEPSTLACGLHPATKAQLASEPLPVAKSRHIPNFTNKTCDEVR